MKDITKEVELDLGDILEGSKVQFNFEYLEPNYDFNANISKVKGSCGCTSVKSTKEGIKGTYSAPKLGKEDKSLDITKSIRVYLFEDVPNSSVKKASTKPLRLYIKGTVIKD